MGSSGIPQPQGDPTFLCSSKRLMKASPVFRLSLEGFDFSRHSTPDDPVPLVAVGFNEKAYLQFLRALHASPNPYREFLWDGVPQPGSFRDMDSSGLAKVGVVAQHYQCLDAIDDFVFEWARIVNPVWGIVVGPGEHELWIFLTHIFSKRLRLRYVVDDIVTRLRRPLKAERFPIPTSVVGKKNPCNFPHQAFVRKTLTLSPWQII